MPTKVRNNVVQHRMIDNGRVVEDVTSVGLPNIESPTTTIDASGMVGAVDMPDTTRVNAMEMSISHNNGTNCQYLSNPDVHKLEVRIARQAFNVAKGKMEMESVKCRATGVHKSTEKGNVETGNPLGYTEKYSLLTYEEEINGEVTVHIDIMAGKNVRNGKDYAGDVNSLLN